MNITAWVPSSVLQYRETATTKGRAVMAPGAEVLKRAVEEHPSLTWKERLLEIAGQRGEVVQDDDSDSTSAVRFPDQEGMTVWLPTDILENIEVDGESDEVEDDGESKLEE